jgi:hypothetical protein
MEVVGTGTNQWPVAVLGAWEVPTDSALKQCCVCYNCHKDFIKKKLLLAKKGEEVFIITAGLK